MAFNVKCIMHLHVHTCIYMYMYMYFPPHDISGSDVTVVGYGAQLQILRQSCDMAHRELGVSCELIDLRTILPWDEETIIQVHTWTWGHTPPIQFNIWGHTCTCTTLLYMYMYVYMYV